MRQRGQIIGGARLLERIHQGAHAEVWRAAQLKTEEAVIVRALRAADDEARARFIEQGRQLAELGRSGFAPRLLALDVDEAAWVTEPVDGIPLEALIRAEGPLDLARALERLGPLIDGLERLHALGLCHGRLRPSHVLLDEARPGQIWLMGLGHGPEARGDLEAARFTEPERPEEGPRPASDVYGVAALLYYAVTGRAPFDGPTPYGVRRAQTSERLRRPSTLSDDLPLEADAPFARALDAEPAARPAHLQALRASLEPFTTLGRAHRQLKELNRALELTPPRRRREGLGGWGYLLFIGLAIGAFFFFKGLPSVGPVELSTLPRLEPPVISPRLSEILRETPRLQVEMEQLKAQLEALELQEAGVDVDETVEALVATPERLRALRIFAEDHHARRLGIEWVALRPGRMSLARLEGPSPIEVFVNDVELSRGEITVAQYAACVEAGACGAPLPLGPFCRWGEAHRDHPINCVTFPQARRFAAWIGARLPTEVEWIYAARSQGLDAPMPWGEAAPTCRHAVFSGCLPAGTLPGCKKRAGRTAQGLCDMIGNVEEWVEAAPETLGGASPSHLATAPAVCGGGFLDGVERLAPDCRADIKRRVSPQRGFRVARPHRAEVSPSGEEAK